VRPSSSIVSRLSQGSNHTTRSPRRLGHADHNCERHTIESVMHQINEELGIPPEQQRFIVENEGEGKGRGKGRGKGNICKGKSKKGPYLLGIHNPMLPLGRFYYNIRRRFITCVYYPCAVHEQFTSISISLQKTLARPPTRPRRQVRQCHHGLHRLRQGLRQGFLAPCATRVARHPTRPPTASAT
jgi:hypothetical protein